MFARTRRLTLRPAWPEDAAAVAAAIGHEDVTRMLMRVPHPYTIEHAEAFVGRPRAAHQPRFLVTTHEHGPPALIGGIAIDDHGEGFELGYWLTPSAWGRGYATEAGRAVIDMARHALPIDRLTGWHFADNPASGRVLAKLGFRDTGRREAKQSIARADPAIAVVMELDLHERAAMPIAA